MAQGGKRTGAGRPKGSINKSSRDLREAAQKYTDEMLRVLVKIARDNDAPRAAQVAAAKEVFDRAVGKATQTHEGNLGLVQKTHEQWLEELASDDD